MTLDTILCDVTAWQRGQFPHATPASIAKHLLEEAQELQHAPSDRMEIADVQILLAGLAAWQGIDLAEAVAEKLAINQARVWGKPDEHGVVKHVEVDDGFAEFECYWPVLDGEAGIDRFAQYPVSGEPSGGNVGIKGTSTNEPNGV